ncbi:hypothetical protein MKX03_037240 [Papaver bracteatum]|nr:hypothetical protein MKX03_037240 [Papaver bracteatum]
MLVELYLPQRLSEDGTIYSVSGMALPIRFFWVIKIHVLVVGSTRLNQELALLFGKSLYCATLALCPMKFGDQIRRKPCPFGILLPQIKSGLS